MKPIELGGEELLYQLGPQELETRVRATGEGMHTRHVARRDERRERTDVGRQQIHVAP